MLNPFVFLPKSRRKHHTEDDILILEENGIRIIRMVVEMERISFN